MDNIERSRLFVRDIEQEPGYEVDVFDPGEEIMVEPGTWEEFVPLSELEGAIDLIRELAKMRDQSSCVTSNTEAKMRSKARKWLREHDLAVDQ